MIGIADANLLNLGMIFCRNKMTLLFFYLFYQEGLFHDI